MLETTLAKRKRTRRDKPHNPGAIVRARD